MEDNTDLLLIADYLADDLLEPERKAMEQRLVSDEAFSSLYAEQQALQVGLRAQFRAEQKEILREQLAAFKSEGRQIRPLWNRPMVWGIAAAVVGLLLLLVVPWQVQSPDVQQLALAELEPYSVRTERGEEDRPAAARTALELYQAQAYAEALEGLQAYAQQHPEAPIFGLYVADALAQLGRYEEAIQWLQPLAKDSILADAAQWRLALVYVLSEQTELAQPLLENISTANHYRKNQASRLLEAIQ